MVHGMTDEEFAAWCEWRKWCSVWRVKEPQATQEELDRGLLDDKTPAEREIYYDYLYGFVSGILVYYEHQSGCHRHGSGVPEVHGFRL